MHMGEVVGLLIKNNYNILTITQIMDFVSLKFGFTVAEGFQAGWVFHRDEFGSIIV